MACRSGQKRELGGDARTAEKAWILRPQRSPTYDLKARVRSNNTNCAIQLALLEVLARCFGNAWRTPKSLPDGGNAKAGAIIAAENGATPHQLNAIFGLPLGCRTLENARQPLLTCTARYAALALRSQSFATRSTPFPLVVRPNPCQVFHVLWHSGGTLLLSTVTCVKVPSGLGVLRRYLPLPKFM